MHDTSNAQLIDIVLGKDASKALYHGSLTEVFLGEHVPQEAQEKLAAARELVRRYLLEELRHAPALLNPQSTQEYLRVHFAGLEHEVFACLFLDNRHRVIAAENLFRGTIDGANVHPREVVKRALQLNAAAVILAHNHPSGVAEPSQADELITRRLKEALSLVDIRTLDHLIVGGTTVVSFAERGLI